MHECSKSVLRRQYDRRFATTYLTGCGIDIGCGGDSIGNFREFFPLMTSCRPYDQEHGDGQYLNDIPDESLDFVHSSHSLEHMPDPDIAYLNWIRVLKQGGHMIITVPDEDMFEQGQWPSVYSNGDHVTSWTIYKRESWCPQSLNIVDFFKSPQMELLKIEKLDQAYRYDLPRADQTSCPITECGIEIVLRKKTKEELDRLGRLPPQEMLSFSI